MRHTKKRQKRAISLIMIGVAFGLLIGLLVYWMITRLSSVDEADKVNQTEVQSEQVDSQEKEMDLINSSENSTATEDNTTSDQKQTTSTSKEQATTSAHEQTTSQQQAITSVQEQATSPSQEQATSPSVEVTTLATGPITAEEFASFKKKGDSPKNTGKFMNFADIMKKDYTGTWYSPEDKCAMRLTSEGAYLYYPLLEYYGDTLYHWDITDRSADGLCPMLVIHTWGPDEPGVTYYVGGFSDNYFYGVSQGYVFYKQ